MADIKKIIIILGGIIAIVGQWWGADAYYLPVIGGALAIIGGLLPK